MGGGDVLLAHAGLTRVLPTTTITPICPPSGSSVVFLRRGSGLAVLMVLLLPSVAAYSVDLEAPDGPLQVGVTQTVPVTVTVECSEVQFYGGIGEATVEFAVEVVPAEGIDAVAPGLIDIDRSACNTDPQGAVTHDFDLDLTATAQAPVGRPLVNTIQVIPNDDASAYGPLGQEPTTEPPIDVEVSIAYFARLTIETFEPLVKGSGAWFDVDVTCECNAPTVVSFTPQGEYGGVTTPRDLTLGVAGTPDEYERTLVYLEPRAFRPDGGSWTFTVTPHLEGDPSTQGDPTSFTLRMAPSAGEKEAPVPTALPVLAIGFAAAALRQRIQG